MRYRSRRVDLDDEDDIEHLVDLHKLCFAHEAPVPPMDYGAWWLVYGEGEPLPVAFAGCVPSEYGEGYGYLKRAGVLAEHRGHELQLRLIRMREKMGRMAGWHTMITDTTDNPPSANSLIRAGYTMWSPAVRWSLKGALYWRKTLI